MILKLIIIRAYIRKTAGKLLTIYNKIFKEREEINHEEN